MRTAGRVVRTRRWAATGLALVVALFAAAPTAMAGPPAPAADHHITAAGHHDHLAAVDHDHIGPAATPAAPDLLTDTLSPRLRAGLLPLGLALAIVVLWRLAPLHTPGVGRDPPRAPVGVLTGQQLLNRLCIARR